MGYASPAQLGKVLDHGEGAAQVVGNVDDISGVGCGAVDVNRRHLRRASY